MGVTEEALLLDKDSREAFWGGRPLGLSPAEYAVLAYLYRHAGRAVSHAALLQAVWGASLDQGGSLAQVRNTITRLRQKLAVASGDHSWRIVSVRGVGYRLELASVSQAKRQRPFPFTLSARKIVLLIGLVVVLWNGGYVWRQLPKDPGTVVWYRNHRVPLAALRIVQQGSYCTVAPNGAIYCFDTKEELAAATGLPLPGVDPETVQKLQESGAVPDLR